MLGGGLTRKSSKEPTGPPGPGARSPGQTPTWMPSSSLLMHQKLSASMLRSTS